MNNLIPKKRGFAGKKSRLEARNGMNSALSLFLLMT